MGLIESKLWTPPAVPFPITVHLDRLAEEAACKGWKPVPRYGGPHPLLRVFAPDVPQFGESITLVPGLTPDIWCYRSSTGEHLVPHTRPARAAEHITRILLPYVTAVRAARSHQTRASGLPSPAPPAEPDPSHAPAAAELQQRFASVICRRGPLTCEWWAIVPGEPRWKIVSAQTRTPSSGRSSRPGHIDDPKPPRGGEAPPRLPAAPPRRAGRRHEPGRPHVPRRRARIRVLTCENMNTVRPPAAASRTGSRKACRTSGSPSAPARCPAPHRDARLLRVHVRELPALIDRRHAQRDRPPS